MARELAPAGVRSAPKILGPLRSPAQASLLATRKHPTSVNAPEVAILGVSKATMQPVWDGKAFQPKLMLPLSLSYDHRVINGAAAARFTQRLSQLLGDIRTILL